MPEPTVPAVDVATNGWTTDTGATTALYAAIDEDVASDTDYVQSPVGPTTIQYYETAFGAHVDPGLSSGHVLRYRYRKSVASGNLDLTVALQQLGPNKLTVNQESLETNTVGWAALNACTIARSTAQALDGVASLEVTATSASINNVATPSGTSGFSVAAGTTYLASYWSRAATVARNSLPIIFWYNSGGTQVGFESGTSVADNTTGWTYVSATFTAPATSVYCRLEISIQTPASAGEVHYFDRIRVQEAGLAVASWPHINIPNTWTEQEQTLTGPETDSITDYSDIRLRFTPNQTTFGTERMPPDAVLVATSMNGATVANLDDDPDAPDASWAVASANNTNTDLRVSFATPTDDLTTAVNQEFRVQVRKTPGQSGTPTVRIELWESGSLVSATGEIGVTTGTGEVLSYTWSAAGRNATGIECRVVGTAAGGGPSVRASLDVGAIEWNARTAGRAQVSWANLELPVATITLTGELWESGVLKQSLGTAQVNTEGVFAFQWNASSLAALSGANVEFRLTSDVAVDVGAIEWEMYHAPAEGESFVESWGFVQM